MASLLNKDTQFTKSHLYALAIVVIGIISRVIPHVANFSPAIVFALYLGAKYSKARSILFVFVMAVASDVVIGIQTGYSMFGSWTFFTYSALIAICFLGPLSRLEKNRGVNFFEGSVIMTVAYWCWTNLGTWIAGGLYTHNLSGFISCYILAIPFLRTALASSLVWSVAIIAFENFARAWVATPEKIRISK